MMTVLDGNNPHIEVNLLVGRLFVFACPSLFRVQCEDVRGRDLFANLQPESTNVWP